VSNGSTTTIPTVIVNPCISKNITAMPPVALKYTYVISDPTPILIDLTTLFIVYRPPNCTSQEIISISSPDISSSVLSLFTSLNQTSKELSV
jgi:hypothetical protein